MCTIVAGEFGHCEKRTSIVAKYYQIKSNIVQVFGLPFLFVNRILDGVDVARRFCVAAPPFADEEAARFRQRLQQRRDHQHAVRRPEEGLRGRAQLWKE